MAEMPDSVKQQAYDVGAPIRENMNQVEQSGYTAPPYEVQGRMSPQIEDRLNSPTRDYYDTFNNGPSPDSGVGPGKGGPNMDGPSQDSGFGPGRG